MEAGSLIILLVIAGLGALWLALPFIRRGGAAAAPSLPDAARNTLVNDYARVVTLLRDLEEDHNTGKISEADYGLEKARLSERGVMLLKALDEEGLLPAARRASASAAPALPGAVSSADQALDEALEAAIARYASAKAKG